MAAKFLLVCAIVQASLPSTFCSLTFWSSLFVDTSEEDSLHIFSGTAIFICLDLKIKSMRLSSLSAPLFPVARDGGH